MNIFIEAVSENSIYDATPMPFLFTSKALIAPIIFELGELICT